ncbi:LysR family transcriptional regulator [Alteromonas sp. ZYF713]|nr:LysR family transcriptional regulator [Alteromonas sp. ZYF713]
MRIDPRTLRLFLAVCREGTISGAARVEHLSQPSVSVAINQLERVLSTKLFERNRQGIQLTPAGEALKVKAQAVDSLLNSAQEEIKLLADDISGPLHIGGTPGALASVMGKVISSFSQEYPRFNLRISECHDAQAQGMLQNYEIDLAILTSGMTNSQDIFCELPVLTDPFSIVVGKAHTHFPEKMNLRQLASERWVLPYKVGGFRRQIDALFINSDAAIPSNVISSDSLLTTKSIVRSSDYITILPREVVKPELENGTLRSIEIEGIAFKRKVGLLWLAERKLPKIAQAFIDHTVQCLDV